MTHSLGLSAHVGRVMSRMINRANCEDGLLSFCTESQSLENLYKEVDEESGYTRNYGRSGFDQFARVSLLCNALNCAPNDLVEVSDE